MESKPSVSEWLPWLGRVRFLVITFLVGVVVAVHQLTPVAHPGPRIRLADRLLVHAGRLST